MSKPKAIAVLAISSALAFSMFGVAGCSGQSSTVKASSSQSSSSATSNTSSKSSSPKSSSSYSSSSKETEKSYTYEDGSTVYKNKDGSTEVTDGWGNAVRDNDGDGKADEYTTDGGATWTDKKTGKTTKSY